MPQSKTLADVLPIVVWHSIHTPLTVAFHFAIRPKCFSDYPVWAVGGYLAVVFIASLIVCDSTDSNLKIPVTHVIATFLLLVITGYTIWPMTIAAFSFNTTLMAVAIARFNGT